MRLEPSGNDEIAQMMDFNQMMDRVDTLMEERVEYGRQIKTPWELKALQAQINPHFLYNSSDLINCTAISRNVPGNQPYGERAGPFLPALSQQGARSDPPVR